jgi:hypothetical protein
LGDFLMPSNCKEYSIKVWDYNYSMAYTIFYSISNKDITVKYVTSVKNGQDSILLKRALSENECEMVSIFLESHHIEQLKNKYSNPLIDDGDQKKVVIEANGKAKTIEISNFYQKDMGELFDTLNKILNKDLRIRYKTPSR